MNRVVYAWFYRGVYGEVNMSKVEFAWSLMLVYVGLLSDADLYAYLRVFIKFSNLGSVWLLVTVQV